MLLDGKRDQFLGKLKEHYGLAKEDAETKVKALEYAYRGDSTSGKSDKAA